MPAWLDLLLRVAIGPIVVAFWIVLYRWWASQKKGDLNMLIRRAQVERSTTQRDTHA